MKSVVICGSKSFKKEILEWVAVLKKAGIVVLEPFLNEKNFSNAGLEPDFVRFIYNGLTRHHFDLIKKADIALFFNRGGYLGVSSTMELGAASALGKVIVAIEKDKTDGCRQCLFDYYVKTPDDLALFLKGELALSSAQFD